MSDELKLSGLQRDRAGYDSFLTQIRGLLQGENDFVANTANLSAGIMDFGGFHWVGFYFVKGDELVLGPFQGPVACTRIARDKGVCGKAWRENTSVIIDNVLEFPDHIACSPYSRSELVIPVRKDGHIIAVLDIDSTQFADFQDTDLQ